MSQPSSGVPNPESGVGSGKQRCSDITVESQVNISSNISALDSPDRIADFTITVFVTNQCRDPVQLLPGSTISYQTNFPALLGDTVQPSECLSQQSGFSGLVPPLQKVPFMIRAHGCMFPSSLTDTPRVTVETGKVVTDKGEKLIPTVTEFLQ